MTRVCLQRCSLFFFALLPVPIRILRIGVSALTHVVSEMSAALLDSRSAEGWLDSNPATSLYDYRMMHSFWGG